LIDFAEHEFWLSCPINKDSSLSRRDHLEHVEKTTGRRPLDLDGPDFPDLLSYIWAWFLELHGTRQQGMGGPLAITFTEIKGWSELTQIEILPEEVELLKRLDKKYLEVIGKEKK